MSSHFPRRLEVLEMSYGNEEKVDLIFKENFCIDIVKNDIDPSTGKYRVKTYKPTPTGLNVHADENSDVLYMQGPFGSGKSVIAVNDIIHRARAVPPWKNGYIRASKALFVRNTAGELKITTLPMWIDWYGDCGGLDKNEKPVLSYRHRFNFFDERNGEKGTIHIEIFFLPLDGEKVLGKIDSLNITFAYVNEMRHMPKELLNRVIGRTKRYPSKDDCSSYKSIVLGDSNPPKMGHWIHQDFEINANEGWRILKQPPGLIKDVNGDWIDNPRHDTYELLSSKEYYKKLSIGASAEFIKVYCLGEYGLAQDGKPVYSEYNDDLHSQAGLTVVPHLPIILGWDFGLTPSCIVGQRFANGRIIIVKEFVSSDMGIRSFASNVVLPWLKSNNLVNAIEKSTGDPAGNSKSQTDEQTCLQILGELGIKTFPASTNSIIKRTENVRWFLNRLIEGKPALIVARETASILREGFMTGYHYRKVRLAGGIDYKYQDEPEKNEYSHPHDALQYLVDPIASEYIKPQGADYSKLSSVVRGLS